MIDTLLRNLQVIVALALSLLSCIVWPVALSAGAPNILWIMADDLRPQLGCYGDHVVHTPHIDKLALRSMRFDRAYVQCAVCSPSRNSMLSGLRPSTTGLRGFGVKLRDRLPDIVTLPEHFKQNGYYTVAFGKIFHIYAESMLGSEDDPQSWSQPLSLPTVPVWGPTQNELRNSLIERDRLAGKTYSHPHDWPRAETWDESDVPDDAMQDGDTTRQAIEFLRSHDDRSPPFFLAVGFLRPHLPFNAPKRYWELYDRTKLALPMFKDVPKGSPAWTVNRGIVRDYYNMPNDDALDDAYYQKYLQAYLASISYVDVCVGRLLDALETTNQASNTIIFLMGDHGHQMGEYGSWGHKQSNYEISTRTPLLIATPSMQAPGKSTREVVEFLDLYPTACSLAGLDVPQHLEGTSFAQLLDDPLAKHKGLACSEMPRQNRYQGYAIRTDEFRYIEWTSGNGKVVARELFDHRHDVENEVLETTNVAELPEFAATIERLSVKLREIYPAKKPEPK